MKPQLAALCNESLQRPSALLSLFRVWSELPEYHKYLCGMNNSILTHVFALLSANQVQPAVVDVVLHIADQLLQGDDHVANPLVVAHIPSLLGHLSSFMLARASTQRAAAAKSTLFSTLQLNILSRVSSYVEDETLSKSLLDLLLPFMSNPQVSEANKIHILATTKALFTRYGGAMSYFPFLSRLFLTANSLGVRQVLCEVFDELGRCSEEIAVVAPLLGMLLADFFFNFD